jgi:serine/threonine-protein kinase
MSALPPKSPSTVAPFSDALGYRVLGFDKKSGDRLEMLRLRPQLASAPAFEAAVRERQRRLVEFRHASFARVRQIDRPTGQTAALAIVSNYADGQRLSELLRQAQNNGVSLELIVGLCMLQQMVTAVAQLHAVAGDIAHGALNPERVVVTPAGRVVITEYVTGPGLAALNLTPQQAWQDYRLALPADGQESFTQASDVYQLGYLGLTLVCGKSIYDRQYPPPFATMLNGAAEITADGRPQPLHPALVSWLTRALRLGGPFASAADAQAALDEAIASAGLVATPDVVAEFVGRCAGEIEAEPATMISMPAPVAPAAREPEPIHQPEPLPAPKAAAETPWTPPAVAQAPAPVARQSGPHAIAPPPAVPDVSPATVQAADAPAAADLADLPIHAEAPVAEAEPELPPAQVWTPKKPSPGPKSRASGSHAVASRPAESESHGHGFATHSLTRVVDEEPATGGSKKLFVIGGIAAVAAAGAVFYFANPFGGASAESPAEPPAATAAAMGSVSIDATPRARVFVDEAPRGTTPVRMDLPAGAHRVRLEADGGVTRTIDLQVVAGKELSQVVDLGKGGATAPAPPAPAAASVAAAPAPPTPGFVTIDATEELQVIENGTVLGISGAGRISLEPGSHLIEFRNDNLGFQTTRTVQVLPGKTTRVTIPLPEGNLSINATPWAEVFLDGRGLGETPIANVTTRAGTHEIVFRHPQHGELKQTVVVKAGELGRVTVNMVR